MIGRRQPGEERNVLLLLLVELGGAAAPRRLLLEDVAEAVELGVEGRGLLHRKFAGRGRRSTQDDRRR